MPDAPDQFQTLVTALRGDSAMGNLIGPDAPILIWDGAGERLLWASAPAQAFASELLDGTGRLQAGSRAGTRLKALAAGLAPREGVRLERLLLSPARLSPPVTCACRLASAGHGQEVLVTVVVGALPKARRSASLAAKTAAPARPVPEVKAPSSGNIRFVWQADPETRFLHVSAGLTDAVGPMAADILGLTWEEALRSVLDDPAGEIAGLFARRETWSGRTIQWSVDNKQGRVPVEWAGMPIFGAERELVGFRGFGLVRKEALAALADDMPEPAGAQETAFIAEPPEAPTRPAVIDLDRPLPVGMDLVIDDEDEATPFEEPALDTPAEMTEEERLFERIRETVAASLSEPTIAIYGRTDEPVPEVIPEPALIAPPLRPEPPSGLSSMERHAFREIARALGARTEPEAVARGDLFSPEAKSPLRPAELPVIAAEDSVTAKPVPAGEAPRSEVPPAIEERPSEKREEAPVEMEVLLPIAFPETPATLDAPGSDARTERPDLDPIPMPALVHRDGFVLFANPAFLDLAGYDNLEHLAAFGGMSRLFGGERPSAAPDGVLTTRQRGKLPVELYHGPIAWEEGDAQLTLVRPSPEVTSAQSLRAREADLEVRDARIHELESVLDTATDGVIVLDETGRILSLNRSAEALFGYNGGEVVGDAITVLLAPESHIVALDYLEGLRIPGVASLLNDGREVMGRVRQGGAIPLFMTMGRIDDGPERKLCAVLRDITSFKKAESELIGARRAAEQANAQKSDLLAKISHEIRTPLNAILGFAEVMLEERFGPVGNERYKEYLKDVHASGAHVISLVNDLLDLAKVEAGRMELSFTSVSLNDLVTSCFTLLQPQASRDRIVMRTSFAAKLPPVVADDRSLRQIVLNLVSNAIKFTDAGGQVIVSTALTDRGEVAFRVRDTGIGMNDEEVAAALEPFRQLATSRRRGGTGLGLPLTKALVEANRGALQISSQPNEGTLVEVLFPPTRVLAE